MWLRGIKQAQGGFKMAEYVYSESQTVSPNTGALLNDSIPCAKGYVIHRTGSGILTLRGIVNNPCAQFAEYKIGFEADIAVPEDGAAGPISLAFAIDGEVIPVTIATVTPTVAGAFFHVSGQKTVRVPRGCCYTLTVENNSDQAIIVEHLNVPVSRTA
jgi:hypothetical protein